MKETGDMGDMEKIRNESADDDPLARPAEHAVCAGYTVEIIRGFSDPRETGEAKKAVYGLRFFSGGSVLCEYPAITCDVHKIRILYGYFLNDEIDRVHIADIVEDFAAQLHFPAFQAPSDGQCQKP